MIKMTQEDEPADPRQTKTLNGTLGELHSVIHIGSLVLRRLTVDAFLVQ